ncbi:metallopeptidase family protein [Corynebacterium mendelii]|uniref:Metallopeptidase family protein n=1 Tax=Corynebacterium mendelii TaxID=2765362 RepID=A0A939E2I8_9CORY|nr:metallopeptidase family protein [Corynebacterium mendelii]MBN9645285.1 metallopeptidase family protein [Corynebacterium mendelii]
MIDVSDERFEELVDMGLDRIPKHFIDRLDNVAILIEEWSPKSNTILGLYHGTALPERLANHTGLPSTITIYKEALKNYCRTEEELIEEVATTVGHEIGHHFGLDDEELHRLGW